MFDWVWNLLYGISKSIYSIIDNLLSCANMLCGIEPIRYAGQEMDFISFLLNNKYITYGFVGAVLVAITLIAVFSIFAIVKAIGSEKSEKTPTQIAISVAKTLLIFLFIPVAFTVLIFFTNTIMRVLYTATLGGSNDGIGRFLAGAFGYNARKSGVPTDFYLDPSFNYTSTGNVRGYLDLSDYDYFFSWLAGIVIIMCLGSALLMFVDRAISVVILFIFAPLSLSTTILDDGAHFKLWRDQFITKFLMGYGCIIAINIYALIIGAISNDALVFFDNSFLNNFMKIVIIVGGGVSMMRVMALVGNLISAGAGSNELRDNAIAAGSFRRIAAGATLGLAKKAFGATRSSVNFVRESRNNGFGTAVGRSLGFKTSRDFNLEKARLNAGGVGGSGAVNNNTNKIGGSGNAAKNAILGGANPSGSNGSRPAGGNPGGVGGAGGNGNHNNPPAGQGNGMVNNAINNSLRGGNNPGGNKK